MADQAKNDEDQTVEQRSVNVTSRVNLTLAIIALAAPIFYIIGAFYHHGYLDAYGLTSEAFPISVPEAYEQAYFAIFILFARLLALLSDYFSFWSMFALSFVFLLVVIAVHFAIDEFNERTEHFRFSDSLKRRWFMRRLKRSMDKIYLHYSVSSNVLALALIFMLLWIFIAGSAFVYAKNSTLEVIDEYEQHGCAAAENSKWQRCVSVLDKDKKVIAKGLLAARYNDRIAIYHAGETRVWILSSSDVVVRRMEKIVERE